MSASNGNSGNPRDRGLVMAACAVALATAVGASGEARGMARTAGAAPSNTAESQALQQILRYCTSSWRNAGVRRQDWEDCTQQTLLELLESLTPAELAVAMDEPESAERRELNRAIWRITQRSRRQTRTIPLVEHHRPVSASANGSLRESWQQVEQAARECLTDRQRQILELSRDGWRVAQIAAELHLPTERVSDEKYKAVHRLRAAVSQD